jgi:exodeoxyribonuclease VII small subunit
VRAAPAVIVSRASAVSVPRNAKSPEFEAALSELEALVERLERGDLPLEEALKAFERGVALTRHCQACLQSAQQKVEMLVRKSGEPQVVPFEESAADSEGPGSDAD